MGSGSSNSFCSSGSGSLKVGSGSLRDPDPFRIPDPGSQTDPQQPCRPAAAGPSLTPAAAAAVATIARNESPLSTRGRRKERERLKKAAKRRFMALKGVRSRWTHRVEPPGHNHGPRPMPVYGRLLGHPLPFYRLLHPCIASANIISYIQSNQRKRERLR